MPRVGPMTRPGPDCWLHPDVRPALSPIAGTGLFATAPVAAGAEVARVGGRLVTTARLQELFAASERYVDTIVVDDDLHLVLPSDTDVHFGNHSCEPSVGWGAGYTLVALRDLSTGDEVTHDYATSTADPSYLLRCHCGSYRCRQMVEGTDWRIPQLQRRYAGHWLPHLQWLIDAASAAGG